MEVSKFVIGGSDVYVKDTTARSEIEEYYDSMSEINSAVDSLSIASSESFDDIELNKQDVSSAWKIRQTSVTETVTINSLDNHLFTAPIPNDATNVIVLNARSSDTSRTLIPINLYTSSGNMCALMSNQRTSAYENVSMTIQFTYAYQ